MQGWFCTVDGWCAATLAFDRQITERVDGHVPVDAPRFLPAPVDLHVHGGGGHDVMQGDAAIRGMLQASARGGTGALLATSVTAPFEAIDAFIASAERVMAAPESGEATLLGVHLEGPFINPGKLGAQPPHAAALSLTQLERWLSRPSVRVMTYAPELDEADEVPALAAKHGVRVQVGHTLCSWARAKSAMLAGAGVTHLWNAMSGATHRDGGAALAALAYARHAEIIADGIHVDRAAFDAARRAIPGLCSITDATAAAGMPDGDYRLGSLSVCKRGNRVELADGTLAGSCLTARRAIDVLRGWEVDWPDIVRLTSASPVSWIGEPALGSFERGTRAHWLELEGDRAVALWLDGTRHSLTSVEQSGS